MADFERHHVSKLVPSTPWLYRLVIMGAGLSNVATLGYDASVMNGLNILPSYVDYFDLTTATTGLNTASYWIGCILACSLIQPVPDKYGRKVAILTSALICLVGAAIQAAAQNIAMFIVGRIIIGFGSELASAAAPTLLGEALPAAVRGTYLGMYFSLYATGQLVASIVVFGCQNLSSTWAWRAPSLLQASPSLLALLFLPFVPESPRWLVSQGKTDHAREVLAIMLHRSTDPNETPDGTLAEIEAALEAERELMPRSPWAEIVRTPGNRRRLAIVASFGIMLQMLGNYVVSYYLTDILDQAGVTGTTTQTQVNVILSCWALVVSIAGSYVIDLPALGRKGAAMLSISGIIVCLYVIGGLIKVYGSSTDKSGIYGTIAVVFLFQAFYSLAITPLTSTYPTEVCQFKIRTTGLAVFRLFETSMGLMASFAMSYAMADLGWKFYIINASWDIVFLAAVYFLWVETQGQKLEEIAVRFDGPAVLEGLPKVVEEVGGGDRVDVKEK